MTSKSLTDSYFSQHYFSLTTSSPCAVSCTLHSTFFSFSSVSQAPKQLYHPCNYTTFGNNLIPESEGPLKFHYKKQKKTTPLSHTNLQIHCNTNLLQCKTTTSFTNQNYFHLQILPVGAEAHTTETCYSNKIRAAERAPAV